jgi:hypothetical protein
VDEVPVSVGCVVDRAVRQRDARAVDKDIEGVAGEVRIEPRHR